MKRFEHKYKHSLEHLSWLYWIAKSRDSLSIKEYVELADHYVMHGLPDGQTLFDDLKRKGDGSDFMGTILSLEKRYQYLDQKLDLRRIFLKRNLVQASYDVSGYQYIENKTSKKLLVVFVSSFNNFYISNLMLIHLCAKLGTSILIFKDDTFMMFMGGVSGIGDSVFQVSEFIERLASSRNKEQVYISGYCTGGVAAMFCSIIGRCDGFLGFSHFVDFSNPTPAPNFPSFHAEIESAFRRMDDRVKVNYLDLIRESETNPVYRKYIYGLSNALDRSYAAAVDETDLIEVQALPDSGHATPGKLLEQGSFLEEFESLLSQ